MINDTKETLKCLVSKEKYGYYLRSTSVDTLYRGLPCALTFGPIKFGPFFRTICLR